MRVGHDALVGVTSRLPLPPWNLVKVGRPSFYCSHLHLGVVYLSGVLECLPVCRTSVVKQRYTSSKALELSL